MRVLAGLAAASAGSGLSFGPFVVSKHVRGKIRGSGLRSIRIAVQRIQLIVFLIRLSFCVGYSSLPVLAVDVIYMLYFHHVEGSLLSCRRIGHAALPMCL